MKLVRSAFGAGLITLVISQPQWSVGQASGDEPREQAEDRSAAGFRMAMQGLFRDRDAAQQRRHGGGTADGGGSANRVAGPQSSRNRPAGEFWRPDVAASDWQYVILHHSATDAGSVESIHAEHRQRTDGLGNRWLGIGYHFVVGNGKGMPDGQVVPTFRWQEQLHGSHSGHPEFNARGIGICLIGNFELQPPTVRQLAAVKRLVRVLAERHKIPRERVIGHSSVKATSCPGAMFSLQDVREVVPERNSG